MKLSIVNRKGGVGKTTTAINLAAALAQARTLGIGDGNFRTLLVDLDSQANASIGLGIDQDQLEPSISSVIMDGTPVADAIRPTSTANLHLITASDRIAEEEHRFYQNHGAAVPRLKAAIDPLGEIYHCIIFDCPPALGTVFTMAMLAADVFLVPLPVQAFDVDGLTNLFTSYRKHRQTYGADQIADLMGIALANVNYQDYHQEVAEAMLRDTYADVIFQAVIRSNRNIYWAQNERQTIFQHSPNSRGAEGYRLLAREVIHRARARDLLPAAARADTAAAAEAR